ncbi:MAG TPA: PadR family transcriptional regulator [Dehalococcoidia bacterium]|nr:PadR family transcriptional regulator [Dehalococcoidia bacterium]
MFRDRASHGERFFRGRWRESSFQKGDLKYVILDLIKDKPRHGYEIIRELEELSHGFYTPSPGAVYPTLQMLEEMGYTSAAERDGKKIYTITEAGLKFLDERKDSADEVRSQMKRKWSFKNIGKMALLMKEYHALENLLSRALRSLDADKMQRIREVLINAYKEIEAILAE